MERGINDSETAILRILPSLEFYKYGSNLPLLPPSPDNLSIFEEGPNTNKKSLKLVRNFGYLWSRINKVKIYSSSVYDPLDKITVMIIRELRKESMSVRELARKLGLSQRSVRYSVEKMYYEKFFI
uniref:Uncharacterized protein n=1 Tax=viral metagenome TaxID=1070528 RepID=A0A6C0KJW1_9ZZZZ